MPPPHDLVEPVIHPLIERNGEFFLHIPLCFCVVPFDEFLPNRGGMRQPA
jgi:hypothetical protein